jgi:pimeloyl-ACP methyl ester carboxylesterase
MAAAVETKMTAISNMPGVTEKTAAVDGVKINYKIGGRGPVVVLLHGYTQTSHMWMPLMPLLAATHTVIAPDLRGAGGSERAKDGYDKKTLAKDIRDLVRQLGYEQVQLVGHDIGLMVAYAYAAQYAKEVSKVVLMDAFLPGVGNWKDVWLLVLQKFRAGRKGLRGVLRHKARHAVPRPDGREGLGHFPHRANEAGRYQCVRHRGQGLRSLADGGSDWPGCPGDRRVPQMRSNPKVDDGLNA